MDQKTAAVHVTEKLVPQPNPFARAFNQAGDVRHHKGAAIFQPHHAEHRCNGRKMIVANGRLRLAHDGNQGRFAHIRIANQPDVCQKLQLQD